jgi:hypothetical protein
MSAQFFQGGCGYFGPALRSKDEHDSGQEGEQPHSSLDTAKPRRYTITLVTDEVDCAKNEQKGSQEGLSFVVF